MKKTQAAALIDGLRNLLVDPGVVARLRENLRMAERPEDEFWSAWDALVDRGVDPEKMKDKVRALARRMMP